MRAANSSSSTCRAAESLFSSVISFSNALNLSVPGTGSAKGKSSNTRRDSVGKEGGPISDGDSVSKEGGALSLSSGASAQATSGSTFLLLCCSSIFSCL